MGKKKKCRIDKKKTLIIAHQGQVSAMKMELSIYEGALETMVLISRNSFPKTSWLGSFYLTNQISSYKGSDMLE